MTDSFHKMHGLGNDFVILDARKQSLALTPAQIRRIADRRRGIGCDQVIILEPSEAADVFMRIHNADGSEAGACGNASRCIADLVMAETDASSASIETLTGTLAATRTASGTVAVDMGPVRTGWKEIPLSQDVNTAAIPIKVDMLSEPVGINVGNPHAVFFVPSVDMVPLEKLGGKIETHPMFPKRVNVSVAQVINRGHIRLRVWERGVGMTEACGTATCATAAAGVIRGLTDRQVTVSFAAGDLQLEWREDGHIIMSGPVSRSFKGTLDPDIWA